MNNRYDGPSVSHPPRLCVSAPSITLDIEQNKAAKEKWESSMRKIGNARSFINNGRQGENITHSLHQLPLQSPDLRYLSQAQTQNRLEADNGLSWRRMLTSRQKLKASSSTSEILAAFALITMVELQINDPTEVPEWLFILFSMNTTIVVSLNVLALMISNYILPGIEAAAKIGHHNSELFAESPHDRMKTFTEIAWILSNILGLLLFFVQLALLLWVKFWDFSFKASLSAMVIIAPFLFVFIGSGLYFYHVLAGIKSNKFSMDVQELENMSQQLDSVV